MTNHLAELIAAYIDDELDSAQNSAVETHVATCPSCRRELEQSLRLRELFEREPPIPLHTSTADFWQTLQPLLSAQEAVANAQRPDLGMAWVWGGVMVLFAALSQAIFLALTLSNVATRIGYPLTRWLPIETINLLDSGEGPGALIISALESHLFLLAFSSPLAPLLPVLVLLVLTAAFAMAFLGWGLARLYHPQSNMV
ncbi:MAG: hypothetical protein GY759_12995 [Chloroflexi bacterium]|nr:hypothetical protein [Chloroflexota bacterium]